MYCVYKLENNRGEVYYGMSKDPKRRLKEHRRKSEGSKSKFLWQNNGVVDDMEILDWFDNKEDCHKREKELIQNNNCVNLKGKYTTQKEYYEKNKEEITAKTKQYYEKNKEKLKVSQKEQYEKNKEKIRAQQSEKIKCDICGSTIRRDGKTKHQRTAKCKSFLMDT